MPRKGSALHALGAHDRVTTAAADAGIRPARAGSTTARRRISSLLVGSARTRGEHCQYCVVLTAGGGSASHARGARVLDLRPVRGEGISPARAGSTRTRKTSRSAPGISPARAGSTRTGTAAGPACGDQPRTHGEHFEFDRAVRALEGTSPARAGSTTMTAFDRSMTRDQPRTRGEHSPLVLIKFDAPGSAPHTRGACGDGAGDLVGVGISPACAGSTPARGSRTGCAWDQPRTRGEYRFDSHTTCGNQGSAPHARGARGTGRGVPIRRGISPARPGSTTTSTRTRGRSGDQPCTRGEHTAANVVGASTVGSALQARGA